MFVEPLEVLMMFTSTVNRNKCKSRHFVRRVSMKALIKFCYQSSESNMIICSIIFIICLY